MNRHVHFTGVKLPFLTHPVLTVPCFVYRNEKRDSLVCRIPAFLKKILFAGKKGIVFLTHPLTGSWVALGIAFFLRKKCLFASLYTKKLPGN